MNAQAQANGRSTGAGATVLFLPKNNRNPYFKSLLLHGKAHEGWRVSVVCQPPHKSAFTDIVAGDGRFFEIPDFTQPQPWETDKAAVAALHERIAAAERASGVPANRLLLAGARTFGRAFGNPQQLLPNSKVARHVLRDNRAGGLFVRRIFAFAFSVLDALQPDLVLSGEWSTPVHYAIALASRARGIPCIANRPSKIVPGNLFWTSELSMLNEPSRRASIENARSQTPVSDRARELLAAFRCRPETPAPVSQKWKRRDTRGVVGFHLPYLRLFAAQAIARMRGAPHTQPDPALAMLLAQYRMMILRNWQRRFFRSYSEDMLGKLAYVYFPLHKEAEVALSHQSPLWYNQAHTVRMLAAALPAGVTLLVREHRSNHGCRPSRWYRDLLRLPQVALVDSFDSQFKYLRHAQIVVTENGTSGWEALILGRRVMTLSRSHQYDGAGLAHYVANPAELGRAIVELLAQPAVEDQAAHDRRLGCHIDAEYAHSFPEDLAEMSEALVALRAHCSVTVAQS